MTGVDPGVASGSALTQREYGFSLPVVAVAKSGLNKRSAQLRHSLSTSALRIVRVIMYRIFILTKIRRAHKSLCMRTVSLPTSRAAGRSFSPTPIAGVVLLFSLPVAHAATIVFAATNLADTTPGQDLWQYQYSVSDLSLIQGQGFSIFFDLDLYANLQSPPPSPNTGWDLLTIQSDPALESNGFFDALALQAAPSLANPFTLTFVWLGAGLPGSQPFTVNDVNFSTIAQGVTIPPNSAPLTLSLLPLSDANKYQLVWSPASAVLEQSSNLTNWTQVAGAVSPLTLTLSSNPPGSRFYRLRTGP